MNKNKKIRIMMLCLGAFVVVALVIGIFVIGHRSKRIKVGFIMSGSIIEDGWNHLQYEGVKGACEELGTELLIKENVEEFSGKCEFAIRDLVSKGAKVIILSSYGYAQEAKEVINEYSDIFFYENSTDFFADNLSSYFGRMYQARYLSGIVAGLSTKTQKIGYVAAMNNNEVNRGINAFTLGVRSVNPDAKVIVSFTGAWDDVEREKEIATSLIRKENVDLLTYHQNMNNVAVVADEASIDSIGYHEAGQEFSPHYLTTVKCDWKVVYEYIIKAYLQGKAGSKNSYWLGIEENAVGLSEFSQRVSDEIINKVNEAKNKMLMGQDVFSGLIYDNTGKIRCNENEVISDEVILKHMDWFVEGVEFYEK